MNLFLAGHETTANALTWALHLLLLDRGAARRLRDESERVGDAATPDIVDRAPYAVRVFHEAMRLFPPVHSLGRVSTRPVHIGAHVLPAGAIVIVSPLLMHRRAAYFEDPDRFDPDRFARPPPRYAYLPFGAGPRGCVGAQLATIEAAIVLSTIARTVELEGRAPDRIEPEMLVTLRPKQPVLARVHR